MPRELTRGISFLKTKIYYFGNLEIVDDIYRTNSVILMKFARFTLFLLSLLTLPLITTAQKGPLDEADNLYENIAYYEAIDAYKKAYSKVKKAEDKKLILYKIGMSYYFLEDNQNAESWLDKAVKSGYSDPEAQYFYADAIRKQGRYDDALVEFQKYKDLAPNDAKAQTAIKSCQVAQEWVDNPTRYSVEPDPLLNSKQFDFSPTYADKKFDELIFTSTREGSMGNEIDPNSGESFSALWYTKRDKKGKWSVPQPLPEMVNSPDANEGSAAMDDRYKELYFTRCATQKNKKVGCVIYKTRTMGRSWAEAELVDIKKPDTSTIGHPTVGLSDDSYMFFASDMPGGKGGKDIWLVKYDKREKTWSAPINIEGVNTDGDEMFPYIRQDGRLYFASNGHPGMGGLDIFVAERNGKNDSWGNVQNMQYPINSSANDFGIIFEGEAERGYLTSDRDGTRGKDDIWSFRIPPLKFIIDGVITDLVTGESIPGATVLLTGTDGSSVQVTADELGYYEFDEKEGSDERYILEGTSYTLEVSADGYLKGKGQETTVGIQKSTRFKHDFKLQPMKGEIDFPEVRYDLGKWELQVNDSVNSKDSLDYLYQTLTENPNIVIELMAHTDTRGSDAANQKLSQKRAQSCVDYLVSKGINADRMMAKGYGESQPRISDEQIAQLPTKEEQEAAHQKNRRTTFKVLRDDYVPPATEESSGEEETPSEE